MPIPSLGEAAIDSEEPPSPNPASTKQRLQQQQQDHQQEEEEDKLRDGPCHEPFALLQQCQRQKRIVRHDRALTACVDETDLLIRCIHRNPAYFQAKK